jgi:hypothetical protein
MQMKTFERGNIQVSHSGGPGSSPGHGFVVDKAAWGQGFL